MALSEPMPRKALHNRMIKMDAYYRDDGLWDIEGRVTDIKAYSYTSEVRGEVRPGDHVHDMFIRLTLDDRHTVVDVEVSMDATPFDMCVEVEPNFKILIGLKVGPGWMKNVRERVGGKHGCVHVVELFAPMATVAFQSVPSYKRIRDAGKPRPERSVTKQKPFSLGGCYSWAYDSPMVKKIYPEWYREPNDTALDSDL